jgi:hypothetical protein
MRTIKAIKGQTVFDVALAELGSAEGVFAILDMNPGLGFSSVLSEGDLVHVPAKVINRHVRDYFKMIQK